MAKMRYSVGDKVDASRAENGENHERGVVIDSYELLIGEDRRPMVVVEFEDGERKYMTAATPNVLPIYEDDDEEEAPEPQAEAEPEAVEEPEIEAEDEGAVLYVEEDEGASP